MSLPSGVPGILGDTSLDRFDAVVIGSGAGGSAAAHILTAAGLKVLVLEAGNNYFVGLDDPRPGMPTPLFSSDELKLSVREMEEQDPLLEPRTYRSSDAEAAKALADVNNGARTVGGTAVHADMKFPRLNEVDFRIASALQEAGREFPGANFADWPLTYDELLPFYDAAEQLSGVAGTTSGDGADPFASVRGPYPLPANQSMYVARVLSEGARRAGYHPIDYPAAINTRPYPDDPALRRPACVNCGLCSGYGCPNNSKGSPAVTTLRRALLTGLCQVRYNSHVTRLIHPGRKVTGVEYIDDAGAMQSATADHFILAASTIESARLCLLSDPGGAGLGNSSGQVGRNLMFHLQTLAIGLFKQRLHGERGQAVTNGIADFRGVVEGGTGLASDRPLGGIIEFGTNSEAISEGKNALQALALAAAFHLPITLKNMMLESPLRAHLAAQIMQAEDAPQMTNRVDLDPNVKDIFGSPVPRITYKNHAFENSAADFYKPKMLEIMKQAGAQYGFIPPRDIPSTSRHIMGTLRMGTDPATSVCDAFGKFHDLDNLYCGDGGVFASSSGYNPTLTIIALSLRMAGAIAFPESPERAVRMGG